MYCSKCGALNPDEATFCAKCGNQLKNLSGSTPTQTAQQAPVAPPPTQVNRKDPLVAGILNLFIAIGYVYLGYRKVLGLPPILFVVVVLIVDILLGIYTFGLLPLLIAILIAYDGYVKAKGEKGFISTEPALIYQ